MHRAIVLAASAATALLLAACAGGSREVYHKLGKFSREDAQLDLLTCAKAEVEARRRVLQSSGDRANPTVRRRAYAAGHAAARRCLTARGYKRRA